MEAIIEALKEDVLEIKSDVKEVKEAVSDLRLLMVEKYVTKEDFEAYKEKEISKRRWWATFVIGASSLVVLVINSINHFLS
jgi:hypothetical protein